jgi:hypothetical protein
MILDRGGLLKPSPSFILLYSKDGVALLAYARPSKVFPAQAKTAMPGARAGHDEPHHLEI